jgi:iron complex transport system substrate-binding protein
MNAPDVLHIRLRAKSKSLRHLQTTTAPNSPASFLLLPEKSVTRLMCLYFVCICVIRLILLSPALASGTIASNEKSNAKPSTLVTLAPNLTEIVFALNQGHRIIGVSNFDSWPESVKSLPKMGGYFNPDIEGLIRLKPDMVFLFRGRNELNQRLEKLGFEVKDFPADTLDDILTTIRQIGHILGAEAEANDLIRTISQRLETLHRSYKTPPKVMICVGMTPGVLQNIYVSGGASFHHDILQALGIENVFSGQSRAYFPVNRESIIAAQPDIIIDLMPGEPLDEQTRKQRLATWKGLSAVPAVQNDRIIILNDDCISIPGPRITEFAAFLAEHIHAIWDTTND